MSHPLLHEDQAHAIVEQFHPFGMSESVEPKTKELSSLAADLILLSQVIESFTHSSFSQGISLQKAWTGTHAFRCGEQPLRGVFFGGVVLLDPGDLCQQNGGDLFGNGNFVSERARLLYVADQPELVIVLFQTRTQLQIQHIGNAPAAGSQQDHDGNVAWRQLLEIGVELAKHELGNIFHTPGSGTVSLWIVMRPNETSRGFIRSQSMLASLQIAEEILQIEDVMVEVLIRVF